MVLFYLYICLYNYFDFSLARVKLRVRELMNEVYR